MSKNPFPGPQPYRSADRARFFAREAIAKRLANHVLAYAATTVFGPSGAGKSSLMQAGVIPALVDSDGLRVVRVEAWPADKKPLRWLVNQMFSDLGLPDKLDDQKPIGLKRAIFSAMRRSDRPILIYLDQIEQLFIAGHTDSDMNALLLGLNWLSNSALHQHLHVVLSLREDYVGRLQDWTRERPHLSAHGFRVTPLSVREMAEAMCRTAKENESPQTWDEQELRGLMLDVRMPGQRATDVAEVQTAFAQIVCRALWDERSANPTTGTSGANAEMILRRYLDTTLEGLGGLQDFARVLLEEHLIDDEGHRRILTEKEAALLIAGQGTLEVIADLERAAILRAVEHQGSRYFELGHDWLAKKLVERRKERKEAARRAEALLAEQRRQHAEALQKEAEAQRDAAQRATRIAGVRELMATGRPNLAALVLASVDCPDKARGWMQLAVDLMGMRGPYATRWHETDVQGAAWSPDGERIITATNDGAARIWRVDGTGEPLLLQGHADAVLSAMFSPNGERVVTASKDATARIWNADGTGEPIVLRGHTDAVGSAAFSPDGQRVLTVSSDATARIWRIDGAGEPLVLRGHLAHVNQGVFSPDGQQIATASWDATVRIWEVDDKRKPMVLRGHTDAVWSVAFSPDGHRVVTTSKDRTARIWTTDGMKEPVVLRGHTDAVWSAMFSRDGKHVVTASRDGTARIWATSGIGEPVVLQGQGELSSAAFSPDGQQVIVASSDGTARIWQMDGTGLVALRGHENSVWSASFSPNGERVMTTSKDKTARIWHVDNLRKSPIFRGHERAVWSADFSPDGERIATASSDGTVRIWPVDRTSAPIVLRVHGFLSSFSAVKFSPNGDRLVAASKDGTVRIWSTQDFGKESVLLLGHARAVWSAAFSPDGERVVTASEDGTARIWSADGKGEPVILRDHQDQVSTAAFSRDGRWIVTASLDGLTRIWPADGAGEPVALLRHTGAVSSAMFSPDNQEIVTASWDNMARIWRIDGSREPVVLRGHQNEVVSASFSPDGEQVVTASSDMTARVWRRDGSGEPMVLRGHDNWVTSAHFSPDGQWVITASTDKTARIWPASQALLLEALQRSTTDCLTPMQRETYLLESEAEAWIRYEECERRHGRSSTHRDDVRSIRPLHPKS